MNRRNRKGFTLIELMVVILILGLLVTVLFVVVGPKIFSAKAKLDAIELSKFKQNLELIVNSNEKEIRRCKGDSSAKFFCELFKQKIVQIADMKTLAGASGDKGDEAAYSKESPDTLSNIIFTSVKDGTSLLLKMRASAKDGGVYMCYNANNWKKHKDDGMVMAMCAGAEAEVVKFPSMESRFKEMGSSATTPAVPDPEKDPDFYGKWPFEKIEKE